MEAAVVAERTAELEAAAKELQRHVAALEGRLETAHGELDEVAKEVSRTRLRESPSVGWLCRLVCA